MIQVLLLILKIIGITLLVLLLTVLFLLALVLFVPIRYRARVIHNPEKDDIYGRASFLFPLVVFRFRFYEKVFSYKGRALWYVFAESGKNKEEKVSKKDKGSKKTESASKESEKQISAQTEQESVSESVTDESDAEETKEILEKIKPLPSPEEPEKKKKSKKEKAPKKALKEKGEKKSLPETIKKLLRQKDEVVRILSKQESKESIRFAWDKLKKTIRHIIPRKVKGYLIFGSDDPATTGQVLGVVSVLYAAMGPVLKIVPDFENKRLECDLEFRGRLQVFTLLVILLKIYFNKELKQLIEEIKSIKEIE